MNDIDLQVGDIFFVQGTTWLAKTIRAVEWIHSRDNEATYGHAGVITSTSGETLEALWVVQRASLNFYDSQRILIARPRTTLSGESITQARKEIAIECLERDHLGQPYPVLRLPLFLFPSMAKFIATGHHVVCSELTAKYLFLIGARPYPYMGCNPDTGADEARIWRNIDVVLEAAWNRKLFTGV